MEKPIKGNRESGKRAFEKGWPTKPYTADEIESWLKQGGNYGVLCGRGLYVIDTDRPEMWERLENIVDTFTVKTGRAAGGRHFYMMSNLTENGTLSNLPDKNDKTENWGNIQVNNKYVVGPGCNHFSGGKYEIAKDVPIAWISKRELEEIFGGHLLWRGQKRKVVAEQAKEETDLIGFPILINEIVDLSKLAQTTEDEWQGSHPVHGSTTGQNFTVNKTKNCWHCFRCNSGGGSLSWLAVKHQLIRCDQAQKGVLRGELFFKTVKLARKEGYAINLPKEEEESHVSITRLTWEDIGDPITVKEWRKILSNKFPDLMWYAEACASTAAILLIEHALPFVLVLQGVPGCGKTTTLNFFIGCPCSVKSDKFTTAAFVSHTPHKSTKELTKIDLLPKLKHRLFITPDLSVLFGKEVERLKESLSVLTRVLDGEGLTTQSGVHGTRGYSGDYMFTWIAATTPIPHRIWNVFGNLGARMFFLNIKTEKKTIKEHINNLRQSPYQVKVQRCREATQRFLKGIWADEKIEWNRNKDPEKVLSKIIELASLLVMLRGKINVSVKEDFAGEKVYYSTPTIEHPQRAILALYNLARGHAIVEGRRQIANKDLPILIDVALSSAPYDRVNAFKYLLEKGGEVTTAELMNELRHSRKAAIRAMKTLEILQLVNLEQGQLTTAGGHQTGYIMKLKEELKWFLSDEFRKLWHKRTPKKTIEIPSKQTIYMGKLTPFVKVSGEDGNKHKERT